MSLQHLSDAGREGRANNANLRAIFAARSEGRDAVIAYRIVDGRPCEGRVEPTNPYRPGTRRATYFGFGVRQANAAIDALARI